MENYQSLIVSPRWIHVELKAKKSWIILFRKGIRTLIIQPNIVHNACMHDI